MAYKKEYPVLNDSGAGSLEEYTKRQEDRIEEGFGNVGTEISKLNENKVEVQPQTELVFWNVEKVYTNMIFRVGNITTMNLRFKQESDKLNSTYNIIRLPEQYRPRQDLVNYAPGGSGYIEIKSDGEMVVSSSLNSSLVEVNLSWVN